MYCDYFGFKERPFTIAPNPKYLFMSERHREALAHLVFGVGDSGGFVLLTGEVGTGKTTVCRCLLEQLPEHTDIAFILNPKLTSLELLQTICDDLGLAYGDVENKVSIKQLNDALNRHLLTSHAEGRHTILLIDEAQNLSADVLEQIRLLTNLETNEQKLLQIILIGQPELKDILGKSQLRQLSQRITARYHLDPLTLEETSGYISYRMAIAGNEARVFDTDAIEIIHRISQGVPRLINTICDRSLLGAYSRNLKTIKPVLVKQAAREVLGEKGKATTAAPIKKESQWKLTVSAIVLVMVGILVGQSLPSFIQEKSQPLRATQEELQPKIKQAENALAEVSQTNPVEIKNNPPASLLPQLVTRAGFAQRELLQQWGATDAKSCQDLPSTGLICSDHQGSWGQLLSMNRPAVLTVIINGERSFVTVIKADGKEALLKKDNMEKTVLRAEISPLWNGEYTIIWKPPAAYTRPIQLWDSGQQVQWLEQQLLKITQPESAEEIIIPKTLRFDDGMKTQLEDFQKSQGLRVDGVAGQQTLMVINQLLDDNIPKLAITVLSKLDADTDNNSVKTQESNDVSYP